MILDKFNFEEMVDKFISFLSEIGYNTDSLCERKKRLMQVLKYMGENGIRTYSEDVGKEFLNSKHQLSLSYMRRYTHDLRVFNDFVENRPFSLVGHKDSNVAIEVYRELLDKYLNECKANGNKENTIKAKRRVCCSFLNRLIDHNCLNISSLTPETLSNALLLTNSKADYKAIRGFLKFLYDINAVQRDYSLLVPKYKWPKVLPSTYSIEEIQALESVIDTSTEIGKRDLAITRLFTRMGLRSGDIAKLKWTEINFERERLYIIQEKTGEPLNLQIPKDVIDALNSYKMHCRLIDDGYVFHVTQVPYSQITTYTIRRRLEKYLDMAAIPVNGRKRGPHAFRASLATSMVNDGTSYDTVRSILGHTDPDTIKYYAKANIEKLRACAIDPPEPSGLFFEYLTGKRDVNGVY